MAKAKRPAKVNAGYRLDRALYRWVKDQANREDVRPCAIAERALIELKERIKSGAAESSAAAPSSSDGRPV